MKRDDLVKKRNQLGCELVRHGGKHDWFANQKTVNPPPSRILHEYRPGRLPGFSRS
jgi:hypothetical protein